jgi:isopropylmalate/homocitrate/citramalate synthase
MSKEDKFSKKFWKVSPYNFENEIIKNLKLPEKVVIHDCTLREGEQHPRVTFRKEEKIEIAKLLDEFGVQRIEAGMPVVSNEDKEAIKEIVKLGLNAKIYAFCRCSVKDVNAALDCDVEGVVTEIPSNPEMVEKVYGWSYEKAVNLSAEATRYAHDHGLDVAFFTIDSTRANFDSFVGLIKTVEENGHMDSLGLVDTFGVCHPLGIKYFVRKVEDKIQKPLEIHAHNDYGLAVANSIAALEEGVSVIHATVNGLGERVGNAPLEEIAMVLRVLYDIETEFNYKALYRLSETVKKFSNVSSDDYRPIVGKQIFWTESGIVADWYLKAKEHDLRLVYPFLPEFIGREEPRLVVGKMSGKANIKYMCQQMGLELPDEEIESLLEVVKERAVEKKDLLSDGEFSELVSKIGR